MNVKVVWLIQNLVPYHHSRFDRFAQRHPVEAHLIQVTDKDDFRVLEFEPGESAYRLHTLFPGRSRAGIQTREIRTELTGVLDTIQPDCVCVSGWGMAIGRCLHLWALEHGVPVVMFSESTVYDEQRVFYKEWIKRRLVRSASAALVGGQPHREYIQQLGMPAAAVFDGHNVVDSRHFSAPADTRPSALPARLDEQPYFAVCTRFGEKKNLPRLVRAYAMYREKCRAENRDPLVLAMAGDGECRSEIEREIERTGMQPHIELAGAVGYDALPWFYQHCAAFIHASTTEQWGLVVNEAMAAGAPLILSRRCGCAPDLLLENKNGFGFDPYDEASIANALFRFSALCSTDRLRLREKSRALIAEWGPERFSENLMKAVTYALDDGGGSPRWAARLMLALMQCG
jgi:glycosyltransferase involved in cell wall biosynthesis